MEIKNKKATQEIMTTFYTNEELSQIGFAHVGRNVKISKKASIFTPPI